MFFIHNEIACTECHLVLFCSGVVVSIEDDLLYRVRFYDGQEDVIPREEVYYLTQEKFSNDVAYIVRCEESLVGQTVVARNDVDGLFYLGEHWFLMKIKDLGALTLG